MKYKEKVREFQHAKKVKNSEITWKNIYEGAGIKADEVPKGNIILDYLDNRHGTTHSEWKILIDQMFKTVIDKIVPDYIKIIL